MGSAAQHRPVVTLAALYGAGGRTVGPRVAERLGVQFLGRHLSSAVAAETGLPEEAVAQVGEEPRTLMERVTAALGRMSTTTGEAGGSMERLDVQESRLRGHVEELLARGARSGAVVLGNAGVVVLRSVPGALHVFLRGPLEARVQQAMVLYDLDEATATERLEQRDSARRDYVRRVYGVDGDDVSLYHVVLDSTALTLEACVDIIVEAAAARAASTGA